MRVPALQLTCEKGKERRKQGPSITCYEYLGTMYKKQHFRRARLDNGIPG